MLSTIRKLLLPINKCPEYLRNIRSALGFQNNSLLDSVLEQCRLVIESFDAKEILFGRLLPCHRRAIPSRAAGDGGCLAIRSFQGCMGALDRDNVRSNNMN